MTKLQKKRQILENGLEDPTGGQISIAFVGVLMLLAVIVSGFLTMLSVWHGVYDLVLPALGHHFASAVGLTGFGISAFGAAWITYRMLLSSIVVDDNEEETEVVD